ncbi:MAG: hypothetical protein Q7S09_00145 [bacterium]|nr:hypothetical protein [bacterium]
MFFWWALETIVTLLVFYVATGQILIPLWRGTPCFPGFRSKEAELHRKLERARQEEIERELELQYEATQKQETSQEADPAPQSSPASESQPDPKNPAGS